MTTINHHNVFHNPALFLHDINSFTAGKLHHYRTTRQLFYQIILIGLLLLVNINQVAALKLPNEYGNEQCELIAKDYQKEYGGDLIFIQPLKDNGAYELGAYNGAWINKAWNRELGIYYIDYQSQTYFQNINEIKNWYKIMNSKESEVFNINQGGVPFAIFYHY